MTAPNCPRCGNPVDVDEFVVMDSCYPMRSLPVTWHPACAQSVVDGVTAVRSRGLKLPRQGTAAETPVDLLPTCSLCGEAHPDGECLL